jgi:hypothetical protein
MTDTSLFVDIQLPTVSIRLPTAVETPLSQAYSEDFVSIVHLWNNI